MAYINTNTPVVSVTTGAASSVRVALPTGSFTTCMVINASDTIVFVKTGNSAVEAAATNLPVLPNQSVPVTINSKDTHFAVYCASASKVVYVAMGGSQ